jgi:hypothetical protein
LSPAPTKKLVRPELDVMIHGCNPSYLGNEGRRITQETLSEKQSKRTGVVTQ